MFHYFGTMQNAKGDALSGWFAEVIDVTTSAVIAIYADEGGTPIAAVSGVTNRAKSDDAGNYDFFVADGNYSLKFYNSTGVYQKTQRYLPMYGNLSGALADGLTQINTGVASASASATTATTQAGIATTGATTATAQATIATTQASLALTAGSTGNPYPNAYASTLPKGVTSIAINTAGTGGTSGTYALGVSGGPTGFAGTYTISGGGVTAIAITNSGLSTTTSAPTLSFPSGSVTGAAATATVATLVIDQKTYWVASADSSQLLLYGNNAGAVAAAPFGGTQLVLYGKAAVDTALVDVALLSTTTVGNTPAVASGTAVANNNIYYKPSTVSTIDRWIYGIIAGMSVGGAMEIYVSTYSGGNITAHLTAITTGIVLPTGANTTTLAAPIFVPAGAIVGFRRPTGATQTPFYTTGTIPNSGTQFYLTGNPALPAAYTSQTINGVNIQFLMTGEVSAKSRLAYTAATALGAQSDLIGWPSLLTTGSNTPANYAIVMQESVSTVDSVVTSVRIGGGSASGTATVQIVNVNASTGAVTAITASTTVALTAGVVNIASVYLPKAAGQALAITGGGYLFQNSVNPTLRRVWAKTGVIAVSDVLADQVVHRFEVAYSEATALVSRVVNLENGSASAIAGTLVRPDDTRLLYSDLAGTWSIDGFKGRPTRPLVDGQGYENAAPGARVTFSVQAAFAARLTVNLRYSGLITRTDTYSDTGSVIVNGTATNFSCPVAKVGGQVGPTANTEVTVSIAAGASTVTVMWPYCASLDFAGVILPSGVTMQVAPTRPSKKFVGFGDSRMHGFNVTRALSSFLSLASTTKSAQALNFGYGSRLIIAADATTAGGYGADAAIYLAGYNNFSPGGANLTTIQAAYASVISNYRAAVTSAGKPTSKLIMLSDLWSNNDVGQGGSLAGNSPTLQQFRDTLAAAVTAAADANCVFLSGNTGGMPTGTGSFPDGVHPNDAAASTIAGLLAAVLP